jgi:hypothetical protein
VTPPGIDPETVGLVAQCLNHYAIPGLCPEGTCNKKAYYILYYALRYNSSEVAKFLSFCHKIDICVICVRYIVLELLDLLHGSHLQNLNACESCVMSFEFEVPGMAKISFFGGVPVKEISLM